MMMMVVCLGIFLRAGMNARKTSKKLLYLKVYRYMCAFLAGVSLYIFVLYRTHIKLNNFPSAILGRSLHKSTGWHSGFCVSLVQGLETGLEIIGERNAREGDGRCCGWWCSEILMVYTCVSLLPLSNGARCDWPDLLCSCL